MVSERSLLLNSQKLSGKRRGGAPKCCLAIVCIVLAAATLATSIELLVLSRDWAVPDKHRDVGETFRAGAFESELVNANNATTREEALQAIRGNLAQMEKAAEMASQQGVNVLVFAEYGITGDMAPEYNLRSSVYPYMEEIPAVSKSTPFCVSCGGDITPGHEGQTAIGCIASKYGMYVVGNLIESAPCDPKLDIRCPADGHYQYNTNIVYDPKGCLIAKYHKYHRYAEELVRLDKPPQPEYVFFDTKYGRFGTMICMDIIYEEPAIPLIERHSIDHMLYPEYRDNSKGYTWDSALSFQLAYSTLVNVNFIGANIHVKEDLSYGSAILSGQEVVNFTFTNNYTGGKLIVGDLPISRPPLTPGPVSVQRPTPHDNKNLIMGKTRKLVKSEATKIYGDTYSAVILADLTGKREVCQGTLCCAVQYNRNSTNETYVLGAFKGLHSLEQQVAVEICIVSKCSNGSLNSCSARQTVSSTMFMHLELSALFGVEYVYPSMTPSNFEFERLNWSYIRDDGEYIRTIISYSEWPLLTAALIGRDFKHDPIR